MVYTRLYIVYGIVASSDDLIKVLGNNKDYKNEDDIFELEDDFEQYLEEKTPRYKN